MAMARILIIAGSDSGGGAGIQGDIKTVTALGGYAMTAITALTAQNSQGVFGVLAVPPDFVAQQIRLCLDDFGADAIKTGMLHREEVIAAVAAELARSPAATLVLDPVMVAKGGHLLLDDAALASLIGQLFPRASLITPNIPEASLLTGIAIHDPPSMIAAGRALLAMGPQAVLVKGGHLPGEALVDILLTRDGEVLHFPGTRIDSRHTHGTGCSLASAIAEGLGRGMALPAAISRARDYVFAAIRTAPGFGQGHGPLNHGHVWR